jgi:hypothetical protein
LAGTEYIRQNPQRDKQRVYLMVGVGVEACWRLDVKWSDL